jgi:hypothetical protein
MKGLQKDKEEQQVTGAGATESLMPPLPSEEMSGDVDDTNYSSEDQLYRMVGGVLMMPLPHERRPAATAVPHTKPSPDTEAIQHTPSRWKPVTLPPPAALPTPPRSSSQPRQPDRLTQSKKAKPLIPSDPLVITDLRLSKEDLMFRLRNALVPYHALLLPTGELTVATGPSPKISIEAEVRSGNKIVTRMSGVEVSPLLLLLPPVLLIRARVSCQSYGLNSQHCAKEFQKK